MSTVIGVFSSEQQAERSIRSLRAGGFGDDEISMVAKGQEEGSDQNSGMGTLTSGTTTGGAIGGIAGLLAGIGALAIPGIGPIVAMGPIAATLSGAVAGGIAGGLIDLGIPAQRSEYYEGKVREGKILSVIETDPEKVEETAQILRENGAEDVESH
ncbi:MAG TPA: general stress protein [Bacillota bacterium]|nr:general stress protein [Bacillota bacterium]